LLHDYLAISQDFKGFIQNPGNLEVIMRLKGFYFCFTITHDFKGFIQNHGNLEVITRLKGFGVCFMITSRFLMILNA